MRKLWRRLGFRGQLMMTIAGIMVLGGGLLLAVQYFILSLFLSNAITVQNEQAVASSRYSGAVPSQKSDLAIEVARQGPTWMQEDPVVRSVLGGVLVWSGVLLSLFAGAAVLGAWGLSRRVSRRIAAVTAAANAITERDLSERLNLPGPDDEISQLGTAIDSMVERLESAFHRQEAFIANASHEFRTPLATARTTLQVAIHQQRVPEHLIPDIDDVLDANRRLEELVSALLTIAQGRARVDLSTTLVDLSDLLGTLVAEHDLLASQHQVSCSFTQPETPILVEGNASLLRSLFGNLVANAIRHNHPKGVVSVTLKATSEERTVTIRNSGQILQPELVAKFTEPFQRGANSRLRNEDGSEAGSGLGLTLANSITELHGGKLTLHACRDGGLIATTTLPATWMSEPTRT